MKRAIVILLAVLMCISFACCGKKTGTDATDIPKEKAEITVNADEMVLIAAVKEVNGNSLLLEAGDGSEYVFNFSEKVKVVKEEYYLENVTAKELLGKNVTAIVGAQVQETYPMGLTGERLIIITE